MSLSTCLILLHLPSFLTTWLLKRISAFFACHFITSSHYYMISKTFCITYSHYHLVARNTSIISTKHGVAKTFPHLSLITTWSQKIFVVCFPQPQGHFLLDRSYFVFHPITLSPVSHPPLPGKDLFHSSKDTIPQDGNWNGCQNIGKLAIRHIL
jgi:hypothetical protein